MNEEKKHDLFGSLELSFWNIFFYKMKLMLFYFLKHIMRTKKEHFLFLFVCLGFFGSAWNAGGLTHPAPGLKFANLLSLRPVRAIITGVRHHTQLI